MEIHIIIAISIGAFLIGIGKGGLGAALASLATPTLTLFMPASEAVGLMLPLYLVGDVFALRFYWREWDEHQLRLMLPPAIPGILVGTYLLSNLPDDALKLMIGIITLLVALYKIAEPQVRQLTYLPQAWHGRLAGGVAGLAAAVASAGGLPFSAYLLLQKLQPRIFIGTTTLFFVVVNVLRLPAILYADVVSVESLQTIAIFAPLTIIGAWAGRWLITRIDPALFDRLMVGFLLVAGLLLIL